jgi:CDP-paratose 2-epimerase
MSLLARQRVLITGGAGFIGSNLAVDLASRHPDWEITALDSLHRRGSELTLPRLRDRSVRFLHGDVRNPEDLQAVGGFDKLVECSAESSVMAGADGSTGFLMRTNLLGAYHCFEEAARHQAQVIFLSTSRVYPVATLNALAYEEQDTRFVLSDDQVIAGASALGISEQLPLGGPRTLYGASKLAAELLITEYAESFGLPTVVNRCGVVAGPWQMGKVDQGVFTHWMLAFYFRRPLSYLGFGGTGKQVRDLLHVADLGELVDDQLSRPEHWAGAVVNVGGGTEMSLSLQEASALCREITGHDLKIGSEARTRAGDVRIYQSDIRALGAYTDWRPGRSATEIVSDIYGWIHEHERLVAGSLAND